MEINLKKEICILKGKDEKINQTKSLSYRWVTFNLGIPFIIHRIDTDQQQTEKYALVYVSDRGKAKTMSIGKSGEAVVITTLKVSESEDYSGVVNTLADLNKEGYVLVSSSIAAMNGYLFYSCSLKKSIE